jgi:hypothetical protein
MSYLFTNLAWTELALTTPLLEETKEHSIRSEVVDLA